LAAGNVDVIFNFVTSGSRAGIDHVTGANVPIKSGDIVKCDIGARHGGYCSDIGRSFACGDTSHEKRRIYQRILETEEKVLAAAKPGVTGSDLFSIYLKGMHGGYGDVPWHMIGHGIGLEVHEIPAIGPLEHVPLQPRMVLCVEVGYLEPGRQGYHLEDMILITEDGGRLLTSFPKNDLI
jgi:Xaa-Pro aminopeptidase